MGDIADIPTKNCPNYAFMTNEQQKQNYFQETFDKFIDKYVIGDDDDADQSEPGNSGADARTSGADDTARVDNLRTYSKNILQYFLCWRTTGMLLKKEMEKEWPKSIKIFFFISKQTGHSMPMQLK